MRLPDARGLLAAIAVLLALNLVATLASSRGPAELRVLPAAQAQGSGVAEAELRNGKTLVTASPDGSTLYVWYCRIVNGYPSFEGHRYTTGVANPGEGR